MQYRIDLNTLLDADPHYLTLDDGKCLPYSLKVAKRAKCIKIAITQDGEINVTRPYHTSQFNVHEFVYQKRHWISKKIKEQQHLAKEAPSFVKFYPDGEVWHIIYAYQESHYLTLNVDRDLQQLTFVGDIRNAMAIKQLFTQWGKTRAKEILPDLLLTIAKDNGFKVNRVTIRAQKSRWGSCSSMGNINLNYRLILLPTNIMRYVLVHELCHLHEMNHSSRFWYCVKKIDKNFERHRYELKRLEKQLYF